MSANHVPFENTSGIALNIFPYLYIFDNFILIRISNGVAASRGIGGISNA
jgi:hypothetical protein